MGSMATKASTMRKRRAKEIEETKDIHTYGLDHWNRSRNRAYTTSEMRNLTHWKTFIESCTEEEKHGSHLWSEYQNINTLSDNATYCTQKC